MRVKAVLLLLAALSGQAMASEDDPHRPTEGERAWLTGCLDAADAGDPALGRACAGLLTRACLGHDEPEVPRLAQPAGRQSHPRACAPIETTLWSAFAQAWYREAANDLPPAGREALERSQSAWVVFREASCEVEARLHPGFYGRDLAAECRREIVTTRALELRALAAMAREAKR